MSELTKEELDSLILIIEKHLTKGPEERDYCPCCSLAIYDSCGFARLKWSQRLEKLKALRKELE